MIRKSLILLWLCGTLFLSTVGVGFYAMQQTVRIASLTAELTNSATEFAATEPFSTVWATELFIWSTADWIAAMFAKSKALHLCSSPVRTICGALRNLTTHKSAYEIK